jgi:hypothetical protein
MNARFFFRGAIRAVCILAIAILAACAPPVGNEGGNLVISLPGASAGRAVLPSETLAGSIAYTVTCSGPGETVTQTLAAGQIQAVFDLLPGVWTVAVTASVGGVPIGSGGTRVAVTGQSSQTVSIDLDFYDEEDFEDNNPDTHVIIDKVFTVKSDGGWEDALTAIIKDGDNNTSDSPKNYIIYVTDDIISSKPVSFANFYIKVSLRGGGTVTLSVDGNGHPLTIAENQTLILRDVTLKGSDNTSPLVYVSGGVLNMYNGAEIKDNANKYQGGEGGGVKVDNTGTFNMYGGTISGNTATYGGGVYVDESGSFTKTGGTIYGNDDSSVNKNTANGHDNSSGNGHAVYYSKEDTGYYRDITAGPDVNINTSAVTGLMKL